jgi:hypothetical protein
MKRLALIAAVLLAIVGVLIVLLRMKTVDQVRKIRALEGREGEFGSLAASIRTRYTVIEDSPKMESARLKLGLTDLAGIRLLRFNGEGRPYFYGYVAYDTNRQAVVRVIVDEL